MGLAEEAASAQFRALLPDPALQPTVHQPRFRSSRPMAAITMRLWSLHPKYLDPQGLVSLWRETLLAQAVLRGETRGYRNHPQLDRFRSHPEPLAAISLYLKGIHKEARMRGYAFDESKFKPAPKAVALNVTTGQVVHEWARLMAKLNARNPALYRKWQSVEVPEAHSIFKVLAGDVESWERS